MKAKTPEQVIAHDARLAALREVRAFLKALEDHLSCHHAIARIDAFIKREEER